MIWNFLFYFFAPVIGGKGGLWLFPAGGKKKPCFTHGRPGRLKLKAGLLGRVAFHAKLGLNVKLKDGLDGLDP